MTEPTPAARIFHEYLTFLAERDHRSHPVAEREDGSVRRPPVSEPERTTDADSKVVPKPEAVAGEPTGSPVGEVPLLRAG